MTQEEKQLLLKDLCARIPHGVKAHTKIGTDITVIGVIDDTVKDETEDSFDISFVKPYLRPLSSMTEEEMKELSDEIHKDFLLAREAAIENNLKKSTSGFNKLDWLNSHHFDYRGLIENGLALEAPEGMYKTE